MRGLLIAAGFRVRGHRADCVHCHGSSRLTVAFTRDVAYCHRCGWTSSARRLARAQGRTVPVRRIGRARIRKKEFHEWLSKTYSQIAELEYRLHRKAKLARVALTFFPDFEPAWQALADLYHNERRFELFFESGQDKIGRFELYRAWRAARA